MKEIKKLLNISLPYQTKKHFYIEGRKTKKHFYIEERKSKKSIITSS